MTSPFRPNALRHTLSEIREKADAFRAHHWPSGSIPVDIDLIVEQIGIYLEPIAGLKRACDTVACLSPDMTTISVDQETMMDQHQAFFFRFSLAHEVGHLILHGRFFESQRSRKVSTIREWVTYVQECSQSAFPAWFEQDADEFAGRLLVPRGHLKEALDKALSAHQNDDLCGFPPDVVRECLAKEIHRVFEVNAPVIAIRLRKEKLYP